MAPFSVCSGTQKKAGGVAGEEYRATRASCGLCLLSPWSDARGLLSAYTQVVRSVGREDRPPTSPVGQWGVVHEHTRWPTLVFMNTHIYKIQWTTGHMEDRPSTPKQHTPTLVEGAFDSRPLQLQPRKPRIFACNAKFPFVHEQTTAPAFVTVRVFAPPAPNAK